jgi:hypothetical protein
LGGSSREGQVHTMMSNLTSPRSQQKLIYHPLIHTFPSVTSAQNVGGGSQQVSDHKLKYDMFSQTRIAKCWAGASTLSVEILLEADYK